MTLIRCFFDGACEPVNPGGTGSYGVLIRRGQEILCEASKTFPAQKGVSNNYMEYAGFKFILEWLISQNLNAHCIEIAGDSMLVIKQMSHQWRIKQGLYVPIALDCKKLLQNFPNLRLKWIPREQNSLADKLSKAELLRAGVKFRIQKED